MQFSPPMSLMLTFHDTRAPTKSDFLFDMLYEQQLSMVFIYESVSSLMLVVEYEPPILVAIWHSI